MTTNDPSRMPAAATAAPMQTTPASAAAPGASAWRRLLGQPELVTIILLILAFMLGTWLSPYFLDARFLLNNTSTYIEIGYMALGLVFVIMSGNIDLSVASTLALVACIAGVSYFDLNLPMGVVIVVSLASGALLGYINGWFITALRIPSLAVTLATLALYRGAANILVGDDSRPMLAWSRDVVFPDWFIGIQNYSIAGTNIPLPLVILLVLAVVLGLVLHRTTLGRWTRAIGSNEEAARYSGVPVERVKRWLFMLSGLLSGFAGLVMVSRLGVARYDHARGWELDAITAIVLGGVSINGGRGTMFGAVAAFFLIFFLRTGMGVANIKAESQLAAIGLMLILAVLVSNLSARLRQS